MAPHDIHSSIRAPPLVVSAILALLLLANHSAGVRADSEDKSESGESLNSTRQARRYSIDDKCGQTTEELIYRVDKCAEPLMDILGGTLKKWPRNEEDAMELCEDFGFSERCIKESARKCAKGLQKTIVSTIGTSVHRVRKRECAKSKMPNVLRTTQCIEKHQDVVHDWMNSVVARLNAIQTQEKAAEKKVNAICCMVNDIEREIRAIVEPFCPNEAKFMQRLFKGVVDNAVEIICRNPKCNDYLKRFNVVKTQEHDGMIALILRIVFSLDQGE